MAQTRELFDSLTVKAALSSEVLARAVEALQECEEATTACATAMVAEPDVRELAAAVTRDMDCADVAGVTRRVLTRSDGPDNGLVTAQLEACLLACERSYELCSRHAAHHAHCRLCSQATRRCADMCRQVLQELRA